MQSLIEYVQLLAILRPVLNLQGSSALSITYSAISAAQLATLSWVSVECMMPPGTDSATRTYVRFVMGAVGIPGKQGPTLTPTWVDVI